MSHGQAQWARLLFASLADAGIREVVVSPGSRSTPFVAAAMAEPTLRLTDAIDERAAAFYALGQARASGRPSLLLCTSGTAGANYLPAVVEASASYTPLLVLTADRPVELAQCGANQTIDQLKLFGDHARAFYELGAPQSEERALRALRRTAAQAVHSTLCPTPGGVQMNARAVKPLEPRQAGSEVEQRLQQQVDGLLDRSLVRPWGPRRLPPAEAMRQLATACAGARAGLIVCGPAPISQGACGKWIYRLAAETGFPLLAEAASQVRFRQPSTDCVRIDAFGLLLGSEKVRRLAPDLILQIGRSPVAGAWAPYLRRHPEARRWVLCEHGWQDPESTADHLVSADMDLLLGALLAELGSAAPPASATWQETWLRAEAAAWQAVEEELLQQEALSEGGVVRQTIEALPRGAILALGNSLPIRHADTFCRGRDADLQVWSQRGTSGIDGVVAGAAGAAAAVDRPAALLVGDVSFLHDLGGLALAARATQPLLLVVLHNDGGRIFEQLPIARHTAADGAAFDHWTTPHGLDLEPAARLHGLPWERVETSAGLGEALTRGLARQGCTLIEARVPPHGAVEQRARLLRRLDSALGDLP